MDSILALLDTSLLAPFAQAFSANVYVSGIVMVILNMGTSYLMQDLMPIANRMFAFVWVRRLVFFAIFFTATRDLRVSILLTVMFTLLVDVFLNEDSEYCLIPYEWRQEREGWDGEGDGGDGDDGDVGGSKEHAILPFAEVSNRHDDLATASSVASPSSPSSQWMYPHSSASVHDAPDYPSPPDYPFPPDYPHLFPNNIEENFQSGTHPSTASASSQPSLRPSVRPRARNPPASRYDRFRANADRWALSRRVGYGVRV